MQDDVWLAQVCVLPSPSVRQDVCVLPCFRLLGFGSFAFVLAAFVPVVVAPAAAVRQFFVSALFGARSVVQAVFAGTFFVPQTAVFLSFPYYFSLDFARL